MGDAWKRWATGNTRTQTHTRARTRIQASTHLVVAALKITQVWGGGSLGHVETELCVHVGEPLPVLRHLIQNVRSGKDCKKHPCQTGRCSDERDETHKQTKVPVDAATRVAKHTPIAGEPTNKNQTHTHP